MSKKITVKLGDVFERREVWNTWSTLCTIYKKKKQKYYYAGKSGGEHLFINSSKDGKPRRIYTESLRDDVLKTWELTPTKERYSIVEGRKRSDGFKFFAAIEGSKVVLRAGCRAFTSLKEAEAHWSSSHPDLFEFGLEQKDDRRYIRTRLRLNEWSVAEAKTLFTKANRRLYDRKRRVAAKKAKKR